MIGSMKVEEKIKDKSAIVKIVVYKCMFIYSIKRGLAKSGMKMTSQEEATLNKLLDKEKYYFQGVGKVR